MSAGESKGEFMSSLQSVLDIGRNAGPWSGKVKGLAAQTDQGSSEWNPDLSA